MTPVFLGSHPAMDFLNTSMTSQGEPVELIGDGAAFVDWLVAAGLLAPAVAATSKRRFDAVSLDAAAAAARQLRGWTRDWVVRWHDAPTADYGAEVRRLNALLAGGRSFRQVVRTADGLDVVERMHVDSAADLVALVVPSIAALFVDEEPAFVRRCAGHACTLMFVDRTKAHRRVFCSASTCGNRAKVAAFRARQRGDRGGH